MNFNYQSKNKIDTIEPTTPIELKLDFSLKTVFRSLDLMTHSNIIQKLEESYNNFLNNMVYVIDKKKAKL